MKDMASRYKEIKKQISNLEDRLISIKQEVADYKVPFGKYKGKSLAEIAHIDIHYYLWLKHNNLIPYTINPEIDIYIMSRIDNEIEAGCIREYDEMKAKQGYVGRYMI